MFSGAPAYLGWHPERFNWCLDADTMLSGFWTETGWWAFISAWFSSPIHSPAEMDATASTKWMILQLKWFIALNFYISLKMNERKGTRENGFQWGHLVFTFSKTQRFLYSLLCFGWSLFVVMRLPSIPTETSLDFPFWICAFPEWHASQKIYPPGMEEAQAAEGEADRALGEGEPGVVVALRAARGCTSSRWPREPGQWPFITRTRSNKTASP